MLKTFRYKGCEEMIEQLVNEINGLLRDGYPYSALGIALTLPDICGNIAYPNTKVADHYKKWYSEYVNPISALKFKDGFDEEICYKLRCAYLHSGNFDLGNADAVKNINKFEIHYNRDPDLRFVQAAQATDGKLSLDIDLGVLATVYCCDGFL